MVMVAPGTAAPLESLITPARPPNRSCACARYGHANSKATIATTLWKRMGSTPLATPPLYPTVHELAVSSQWLSFVIKNDQFITRNDTSVTKTQGFSVVAFWRLLADRSKIVCDPVNFCGLFAVDLRIDEWR
jgi:hypothetical protein